MTMLTGLMATSRKLAIRALLDQTRAKIAIGVGKNVWDLAVEDLPSNFVGTDIDFFSSGPGRREGNLAAHDFHEDSIADAINIFSKLTEILIR